MPHTLFDRLLSWVELLARRDDVEFLRYSRPALPEDAVDLGRPVKLPEHFPSDVRAFARMAEHLFFEYRIRDTFEGGSLFLTLGRWRIREDERFNGWPPSNTYTLEADRQGTGQKSYLILDEPTHVIWSLEAEQRFDSLTDYITTGARAAFDDSPCWQKRLGTPPYLARHSAGPGATRGSLRRALIAQGARPTVADDMLEWLGPDARLLLPAT